MHNQKGFVLPILIIVSLLILVVVAYFFSAKSISLKLPTSSPITSTDSIENWKTYRNPENKFELKYPSDWFEISEKDKGVFISNKLLSKISDEIMPARGQIIIKFYFFSSAFENGLGKFETFSPTGDIIVNETKYINETGTVGSIFTYQKSDTDIIDIKATADQILSTFKFTN